MNSEASLRDAMTSESGDAVSLAEDTRVRAAYARRGGADRYSWFDHAHLLAIQERERRTIELLQRHGVRSLADVSILEIGCGTGVWLRELIKWGVRPANLVGIDLLEDRIAEATRLCPAGVTLLCGNAATIELPTDQYDIVLQSMVFTSVLDATVRQALARNMLSAVRRHGVILWYDYFVNNPWNPDVRGVTRSEIQTLFPRCQIDLERITLAAPLARAVAPRSRLLYSLIRSLPFLRTHYLGTIRTP